MRVLLSGGGTAGHVHPALSVAAELESRGCEAIAFVGTPEGPEARMVRAAGFEYHALPARGFDRGSPSSIVPALATLLRSTARASALLGRERPQVAVGFGGYVTLALGIACLLRGVPLVLHEQNVVPGLANRVMSRWAKAVAVTYAASVEHLSKRDRARVTGNPVRAGLFGIDRATGRAALGLESDSLVLLVFGGSRGARHLNEAMIGIAGKILSLEGVVVVHIAGSEDFADVRNALAAEGHDPVRYRLYEWLEEMGAALAAADLVVARAGASSLAEITCLGRASVLVPYPYATDDHQTGNATELVRAGGAVLIPDKDLDGPALLEAVVGLLRDPAEREKMASASAALGRPDASRAVADLALEVAGRWDGRR